jgi:hypothetical protein
MILLRRIKMDRVLLLNAADYEGLEDVNFPVEVEGTYDNTSGAFVSFGVDGSELIRVGARKEHFDEGLEYLFLLASSGFTDEDEFKLIKESN